MKRTSRILCLLLAGILCFTTVSTVRADDISETEEEKKELEEAKKKAEQEKEDLANQLNAIAAEMEETQTKLDAKQVELIEAQDELDVARIDEHEQYESMKLRIKFMYEHGDTEMLEMLLEAKSIGDFLNKAEYIQQVSDYDRQMLIEFQNIVKDIEEKEAKLKEEEAELEELRDQLLSKEDEVENLLAQANTTLDDIESDLKATTARLNKLIKEANEKKNQAPAGGGSAGASQIIGNGVLAWPTTSQRITSYYGNRVAPVAGATSWHDAIDIGASVGTPVYAVADGTVITARDGYNGGRGIYIMVDHGNGLVTRYQHLSAMYVSVGQKVSKGQNIAAVGNTGASSGPHLDFAIYVNGATVDPLTYY